MSDSTREIRKHLMIMVGLTLVVHAIGVTMFNTLDIADAPRRTRTLFTVVWTAATLLIVLNGLYRIRLARRGRPALRRR